MLIQYFIIFSFMSHFFLTFPFFFPFGFYAPQIRIHPKNLWAHNHHWASQMTFHPKKSCSRFDVNFSGTITFPPLGWWTFHGIMCELLNSTKSGGETFCVEAVGKPRRKRNESAFLTSKNSQMCWLPSPPVEKTNPQLHSKVSRAEAGRRNWTTKRLLRGSPSKEEEKRSGARVVMRRRGKLRDGGSLKEVRFWRGKPPPASIHGASDRTLPPLTVRGDVRGAAAIAVGRLSSLDVQVQ